VEFTHVAAAASKRRTPPNARHGGGHHESIGARRAIGAVHEDGKSS
jgi:hypothetical protein